MHRLASLKRPPIDTMGKKPKPLGRHMALGLFYI
jgi:hypothetical protein